jgi:hypothetical protein
MWRKKEFARIYAPSANYGFYRLVYRAAGKRVLRSFGTFTEAKEEGLDKAKEIWGGDDNAALNAREARTMLEIVRAIAKHKAETGQNIDAREAVAEYLQARRVLQGGKITVAEAVRAYDATLAKLKPCKLPDAVQQFTKEREALTRQTGEDGRVLLHPTYHRDVSRVLMAFGATFSGFRVADLTAEHLKLWAEPLRGIRRKTANNHRAALRMFLRWCSDDEQRFLLPDP